MQVHMAYNIGTQPLPANVLRLERAEHDGTVSEALIQPERDLFDGIVD